MADKNKSGDFYDRPEKLGAWAGFSQFLWNGDTKQFMGRTGSSWGEWTGRVGEKKLATRWEEMPSTFSENV